MNATIEDFAKLDIRVVKILDAQSIPDSEKLLKLLVHDGKGERQILAGIGRHYDPTDLIDKDVVAIINLEPRTIMGEESQGMILATSGENGISLITPISKMKAGSKIS